MVRVSISGRLARRTWRDPYYIDTQLLQVVDFGDDASQVAPAGSLCVLEGGWIDLGPSLVILLS